MVAASRPTQRQLALDAADDMLGDNLLLLVPTYSPFEVPSQIPPGNRASLEFISSLVETFVSVVQPSLELSKFSGRMGEVKLRMGAKNTAVANRPPQGQYCSSVYNIVVMRAMELDMLEIVRDLLHNELNNGLSVEVEAIDALKLEVRWYVPN